MTRNVLYITVDALRADRMGFLGSDRATTPVLDDLAAGGTVVERAIANGIPTYYSFKSLLGGIHALSHGRATGLPTTADPLATVCREAGYATAGFNARNPWLTPANGYDRGFDTFRDFTGADAASDGPALGRRLKRIAKRAVSGSDLLTDKLGKAGRVTSAFLGKQPLEPAESVTDAVLDWLETRQDEPFFCWVHYMDPHYPWIPPAAHLDADLRDDLSRIDVGAIWHTVAHEYRNPDATVDDATLETIRQLYDAEVRRTDAAIGRLLDGLREMERFSDTLVTVAGDHGTELYDHGGFSHGPRTLYDEVIRVPLVFAGPDVPAGREDLAGLVDVPPTMLGRTDPIDHTPDSYEGIDLFASERERVSSEVVYDVDPVRGENADNGLLQAQTEPPWKLVCNRETGEEWLYNLDRDPAEQSPVADEAAVRDRLLGALDDHRTERERRTRTVREKARIRRRVRALKTTGRI